MNAGRNPSREPARTRFPTSRLVLLVLIGLCILFVTSYSSRLQRLAQVEGEIDYWKQEIAGEEQRNAELTAEIGSVDSPDYRDEIAREDLGLSMPNDTVIILVEATPAAAFSDSPAPVASAGAEMPPAPTETGKPVWRQWLAVLTAEE